MTLRQVSPTSRLFIHTLRALSAAITITTLSGITSTGISQITLADQCTPTGNVGTCTGCEQCTIIDQDGNICTSSIVCTGPGWPNCVNQTPTKQVCKPGTPSEITSCNATAVQSCTYTCNADGTSWGNPTCVNVGNGGNFQQTFCDFGAGCPDVSNGMITGELTTISQECTQNGVIQSVTAGACGAGGCVRQAVCRPGQPCPTCTPGSTNLECNYCTPGTTRQCGTQTEVCPASGQFPPCEQCQTGDKFTCPNGTVLQCTPDGKVPTCPSSCDATGSCPTVCNQLPECHPDGAGWSCSWNGVPVVSVTLPCPSVQRTPWPRGLVGVPIRFELTGAGNIPVASNSVSINPPTCDNRPIIGYRGTLSWMVENLGAAQWSMDERPWNIGRTSNDILSPIDGRPVSQSMLNGDLTIRNERQGRVVTHIYETSSYDKPANGPGYPDLAQRQPAYQVSVRTQWTLVGNFQYQQRETIEVCKDSANPSQTVACPPPQAWCDQHPGDPSCGAAPIHVTEVISPWHTGPTIRIGGVQMVGALTPQDTAKAPTCDSIATPVIQSQAVLVDPSK